MANGKQKEAKKYSPTWDLSSIPEEAFWSELGRRRNKLIRHRRGGGNGRPLKPTPCPKCGERCESVRAAGRHCPKNRVINAKRVTKETQ